MGIKTISCIVQEVFEALWETLSPIYMKLPSEDEWLTIAKNFETNANFPHCLGAIDGKHFSVYHGLIKPHRLNIRLVIRERQFLEEAFEHKPHILLVKKR